MKVLILLAIVGLATGSPRRSILFDQSGFLGVPLPNSPTFSNTKDISNRGKTLEDSSNSNVDTSQARLGIPLPARSESASTSQQGFSQASLGIPFPGRSEPVLTSQQGGSQLFDGVGLPSRSGSVSTSQQSGSVSSGVSLHSRNSGSFSSSAHTTGSATLGNQGINNLNNPFSNNRGGVPLSRVAGGLSQQSPSFRSQFTVIQESAEDSLSRETNRGSFRTANINPMLLSIEENDDLFSRESFDDDEERNQISLGRRFHPLGIPLRKAPQTNLFHNTPRQRNEPFTNPHLQAPGLARFLLGDSVEIDDDDSREIIVNLSHGVRAFNHDSSDERLELSHDFMNGYNFVDTLGATNWGYRTNDQYQEHKVNKDGTMHGHFGWNSPEGVEVSIKYVADGGGYKVLSSTGAYLRDNPDVIAARERHFQAHARAISRLNPGAFSDKVRSPGVGVPLPGGGSENNQDINKAGRISSSGGFVIINDENDFPLLINNQGAGLSNLGVTLPNKNQGTSGARSELPIGINRDLGVLLPSLGQGGQVTSSRAETPTSVFVTGQEHGIPLPNRNIINQPSFPNHDIAIQGSFGVPLSTEQGSAGRNEGITQGGVSAPTNSFGIPVPGRSEGSSSPNRIGLELFGPRDSLSGLFDSLNSNIGVSIPSNLQAGRGENIFTGNRGQGSEFLQTNLGITLPMLNKDNQTPFGTSGRNVGPNFGVRLPSNNDGTGTSGLSDQTPSGQFTNFGVSLPENVGFDNLNSPQNSFGLVQKTGRADSETTIPEQSILLNENELITPPEINDPLLGIELIRQTISSSIPPTPSVSLPSNPINLGVPPIDTTNIGIPIPPVVLAASEGEILPPIQIVQAENSIGVFLPEPIISETLPVQKELPVAVAVDLPLPVDVEIKSFEPVVPNQGLKIPSPIINQLHTNVGVSIPERPIEITSGPSKSSTIVRSNVGIPLPESTAKENVQTNTRIEAGPTFVRPTGINLPNSAVGNQQESSRQSVPISVGVNLPEFPSERIEAPSSKVLKANANPPSFGVALSRSNTEESPLIGISFSSAHPSDQVNAADSPFINLLRLSRSSNSQYVS